MKPFAICFLLLLAVGLSCALIHDLKIENDNRRRFFIENFGFEARGEIHMDVYKFKIGGHQYSNTYDEQLGFVIKRSDTDSTAFVEDTTNGEIDCRALLTQEDGKSLVVAIDGNGNHTSFDYTVKEGEEGFYNTYFVNCAGQSVSFELKLTQYNIDANGNRNYLSAGYTPLPTLYGIFTAAYVVALVAWIYNLKNGTKRNRVHHLMTGLLVLKILSLFFQTMELHFIKTTGSAEGWDIVYYIFAALKGVMLFVVIALIGTGWSFVKPYLSVREKKIFLIVIPLQILDNIALIIVEDSAPGSQDWETWKDIFRLVDIICCGAILIPIIWSIKHLREASQIDGKAAHNLKQLQIFRQFYLMVVSYIYFTRIIVYLVDATLPFRLVWLGDLFSEAATLLFFVAVGYKFGAIDYDAEYSQLDEEDANSIKMEQYT